MSDGLFAALSEEEGEGKEVEFAAKKASAYLRLSLMETWYLCCAMQRAAGNASDTLLFLQICFQGQLYG